jgi:hypothetical protein
MKHKNARKLTSKNIWGESIPPILVQALFTPRLIFLKHTKDNNKVKYTTEILESGCNNPPPPIFGS